MPCEIKQLRTKSDQRGLPAFKGATYLIENFIYSSSVTKFFLSVYVRVICSDIYRMSSHHVAPTRLVLRRTYARSSYGHLHEDFETQLTMTIAHSVDINKMEPVFFSSYILLWRHVGSGCVFFR